MIWTLLWQFRKHIAIAGLLIACAGLTCHAIKEHDKGVADKAVQQERKAQLRDDSKAIDLLVKDKDAIIDSLVTLNEQEKQERATVREHKKKLVALQQLDQSKFDSIVNAQKDSAVKEVADSLNGAHIAVVGRLQQQIQDDSILMKSMQREIKRKDSVIELKNTQLAALEDFNKRLHEQLDTDVPRVENEKESFGHFIVHKALPVAVVTAGTGFIVYKASNK